MSNVTSIAGGYQHSLALLSDGHVRSWGLNHTGRLGDGTTDFRISPVAVGSLSDVVSITAGTTHGVAVTQPLADLATSIAAGPEPVADGGTLTYTIRVRNRGPTAAEDVVLTDNLPANVRFTTATPSTGTCDTPPAGSTDTVTCHFGSLANGATATPTLKVMVRSPSRTGPPRPARPRTPGPATTRRRSPRR
ncbi:hypothetical protein [Streptomyces tanashiensis]|uniref:DUF11 domain-containing protein n=1 Tax=Streptomyces tanashiensis TaxID=67367 RepID=UPI0027E4BDF3|nr:hypothetical protein [Streptomyces tanashiensis]